MNIQDKSTRGWTLGPGVSALVSLVAGAGVGSFVGTRHHALHGAGGALVGVLAALTIWLLLRLLAFSLESGCDRTVSHGG